ncbi:MAG: hypothetical protein CL681_00235 [Blastopirellula sp.]|nr:hypothetical protein [Blastopirellula sp.]
MRKQLQATLIALAACVVLIWGGKPLEACVQGLTWGMPLDQVRQELGDTQQLDSQQLDSQQPKRFVAKQVRLDRLPVTQVIFELDETEGLQSLAYEFAMDDMNEVLAGLRARHGQPISTNTELKNQFEQIWIWNTGEDLITAVRHFDNKNNQFLISYRPSRLRSETL